MTPPTAEPVVATPAPVHDRFAALVTALVRKRDKAITGRRASGIEDDWIEDEEYYQGIDDANRGFIRGRGSKPDRALNRDTKTVDPEGARSRVFLNITAPYVDAAAARLADMLLPVEGRCWEIKPTPIVDIDEKTAGQLAMIGIPAASLQAMTQQLNVDAKTAADLMGEEIEDHLVECGWNGEVRAVIEDCARVGSGVLKGPVPKKKTVKRWMVQDTSMKPWPIRVWAFIKQKMATLGIGDGGLVLQEVKEIKPGSSRIDYWNFYPDPSCGESIHNGGETWERSYITPKQLRDLNGMAEYDPVAIAEILKEGPKPLTSTDTSNTPPVEGQFEMWTHYGIITAEDAAASGMTIGSDQTPTVNVMAVLVNDKLIKISLNALDTGEYPYDVLAWQRKPGMPWGTGVARAVRTPQRMLNAATRAMMDNSGLTAAPQVVIGNGVTPHDGEWVIRGRKLWLANPDVMDVTKAFYCYIPDSHQPEFMSIIEFARSMAEQTTGMPMLLQGQQSDQGKATDTLGGMQLLQNNATGVLRRLAKRFDDYLTEPHIRRYFNWLMQYSDRSDIKGDFQINAQGSTALVERDSQKQFMFAAMAYAADPAYGINRYWLFREVAKAERMDPSKIQIPEDEHKQMIGVPPPLEQAKIELTKAQAVLAEAKTVQAKIEAMFSAVNTANQAAMNPAIAPAADVTLGSAGFKDANAPPAVAPVAPGTVPMDVPQNTSPGFPPRTPNPDVGVMRGIEGGNGARP